ncbi:helix-turn-helix domain-containing protein [Curtobacterium sp. ISL-83]|uniref:helix-turn-helix domain-containing protein n=1 Tax=Curtobacterium sp. ISL-83 TaxID=2819145 RepID=UPI001BE61343|nr:helix-turn-helix domain-containing protein [Curtobacterium sp. ISL-83]MBT2502097.1 helix-turn-helix transcriptional regulator [Curtobacterium sp. ISL-83]
MPREPRVLDLPSMKALSHPLRSQLFNELAAHGPATATSLAAKVGESTGSTSYHLRQLERLGFIEEVEGRGNGRERWWRRVPVAVHSGGTDGPQSAAGIAAARLLASNSNEFSEQMIREFIARDQETMSPGWRDAADLSVAILRLTPAELRELMDAVHGVIESFRDRHVLDDASDPDTSRVFIRTAAVPIFDDERDDDRRDGQDGS